MLKSFRAVFAACVLLTIAANDLRADYIEYIPDVLGAAGFSQQIKRDYLQDGWTYSFAQDFSNEKLDFGNAELTLTGSLQGQASIGTRGIPEVEFQLNSPSGGLSYDYVLWTGPDKYQVQNGFFNITEDIKLNQYGFYDIEVQITNRGTLIGDNITPTPIDFDLGPINVHGHWVIDLINLTLGKQLGFQLPGGGADQIIGDISTLFAPQINEAIAGYVAQAEGKALAPAGIVTAVPEPATLAVLMFGAIGLWLRPRR